MTGLDRAAVHGLLLGLAGRLPDDDLAMLRTCLADDELDLFADVLGAHVRTGTIRLTAAQMELAGLSADTAPFRSPGEHWEAPEFGFSSPEPEPEAIDRVIVETANRVGGLRAMWRVDRVSAEERAPVLIGEADVSADVVELVAEVQHALAARGRTPRVEVFTTEHHLTAYHEAALRVAELVWQAEPPTEVRLARAFDGIGPNGSPYFRPDRDRLSEEDAKLVAEHLRAGQLVLEHDSHGDDLVLPERAGAVPMNFRSDGTWVWPDSALYYLEEHGIAPDADLVLHALSAARSATPLSRLALHRVYTVLSESPDQEQSWREN